MRNLISIVIASISIAVSAIGLEAFNRLGSIKDDEWVKAKSSNVNFLWVNMVISVLSLLSSLYMIIQGEL